MKNKFPLTPLVMMHTITGGMVRPTKPEHLRRTKTFAIKLTASEWSWLEASARRLGVSVAEMLREGAKLYVQTRGKDGSRQRKEKN
jgi:hypothetical protein